MYYLLPCFCTFLLFFGSPGNLYSNDGILKVLSSQYQGGLRSSQNSPLRSIPNLLDIAFAGCSSTLSNCSFSASSTCHLRVRGPQLPSWHPALSTASQQPLLNSRHQQLSIFDGFQILICITEPCSEFLPISKTPYGYLIIIST